MKKALSILLAVMMLMTLVVPVYADDAQTASGKGNGIDGEVIVEVKADASTIYEVNVLQQNETPGIGSVAVEKLPGAIVEANSLEVDGITGATVTSTAIKTAVTEALTSMGFDPASYQGTAAAAPAGEAQTAQGKGNGIDGEVIVEVKADANTIYEVNVLQQNETPGIGSVAVEKLPGAIVEANSLEVDGITGATVTSTAIKTAVTEALTSMGFDPAGYQGAVAGEAGSAEKTEVELSCDVVVVGAGGAGLTASVMATQQGMNVILLEKMPFVGGNSLRAEGGMNAADTKVQEELGLEGNTVENFVADTLRLGHDLANPDLVQALAENSAEAVDWLFSIDAPLSKVKATGGTQHQYLHQPADGQAVGSYLVAKLSAKAEELGIDVRVNTKATEILMDNGQAVGVKAEDDKHIYTINAKAVVLATGGFGANFDLMASYDPSLANAVTTNHAGAQGDGIMMAQAVGADTVDMEQIQLHPTVIQSNGLLVSESLRSYGAVIVNTEGKRFVNDLAGRDVVSQAELKQPDGYCYIIFDQNMVDHLALTKKFIDGGYALTGDTYVALAQAMGLEGDAIENFVNTMVAWNESCEKGVDEEWGRNNGMEAQSTAPFYAIKIAPGIHHTMGGIKINTNAEVVDTDGNVIPGLFACGETTGGIHGGNRVGGNAVCDFIVFGRIAGQSASAFATAAKETVLDCDVVVIGAGGAGMTAAITATDAGADVIILESTSFPGGNSVRSTGGMNAAPTEWQQANTFGESAGVEATLKKVANYPDNARIQELGAIVAEQWAAYQADPQGYFDSAELFQLDTIIGGGGKNDPSLVKKLVESSESAIAWLDSLDPAVILHNVAAFGGASVKRIHRPVDADGKVLSVGAYVVPLLQQNLEARGITLMTDTPAVEILTDEDGCAVGVRAESADASYIINAKAVVIASGGFGANNDMIAAIRPELDGFITTNAPGIQGQGIQMAQAIGADTVDLAEIQLHPTVHVEGTSANLITEGLRGDGAILVNQEGKRFFDEVSTRDKVSAAEFDQTGGYAWLIVDSRMSDASNVIQGYIKKGFAETGDTYEALAEAIGAPADVFAETMNAWNACVEAKEDPDFGRVSFANPLDQAPYYAIKVQPGIHHTMGGIKIDDDAEVINTDGDVIPGLFAAGEVTGGVHGNNRLGGNAVADFTIFGRIAGQSAADYAAAGAHAEAA